MLPDEVHPELKMAAALENISLSLEHIAHMLMEMAKPPLMCRCNIDGKEIVIKDCAPNR